MKTPRTQITGLDNTRANLDKLARRKRTRAAVACESLEGKKLMTGFAGATAVAGGMAGGPAEMGDMGGFQVRHGGADQFAGGQIPGQEVTASGGSGDVGQVTTLAVGSGQAAVPVPGGMQTMQVRPFHRGDVTQGASASFGGDHNDLAGGLVGTTMGGDVGGGTGGGFLGGPGQGRPAFSGGTDDGSASDVPMVGRAGPGGADASSTGNAQLDTDLKKFRTDSQAIRDKSQVTPALQAAVRKDLEAIDAAKTGTADATKLQTLQADQQAIQGSGTRPTDAQVTQLQADQDAVLLSQGVSQTLIDQLATDRMAVKTASHFTADDQATLDADQAAIQAGRTTTAAADSASTVATTAAADATTTAVAAVSTTAVPVTPLATTAVPVTDATTTTASASTLTPFSSHPMIPAAPPSTSPLAPTTLTHSTTTTATTTRTAGPRGRMGFGHHAGQGFQTNVQDAGGFGGGRARRGSRR